MARKKKDTEAEMTLMDHLNELRGLLFKAAGAIVITSTFCFVYSRFIFDNIILAPKSSTFITYRLLCKLSLLIHSDVLCFGTFDYTIINLHMSGQFMSDMYVSFFAGIIIAFPYILYQIWKFIKPALHDKEKKYSRGAVGTMSFLFLLGILFGYYLIVPMTINFFGKYMVSQSLSVADQWQLDSYISTITSITLGMGVVFELPVLILSLI